MIKNLIIITLVICLILLVLYLWLPYKIPGPANLQNVHKRAEPNLYTALKNSGLRLGSPIFIRIFKQSYELEVWIKKNTTYHLFKTYPICAYSGQLGPKLKEGDRQAPEGFYQVSQKQMNPKSRYHLSFNLGFPNKYDRQHGRTGSYLMVHGNCVSSGCYAITNKYIEEVYLLAEAALKAGQSKFDVHIFPFRMTEQNLNQNRNSPWFEYWKNLQEGYALFEESRQLPQIDVENKKYIFHF